VKAISGAAPPLEAQTKVPAHGTILTSSDADTQWLEDLEHSPPVNAMIYKHNLG